MINQEKTALIHEIWDDFLNSDMQVLDASGNELRNIDELRNEAIEQLRIIINQFVRDEIDVHEFKTNIDSFNKRNNLWGFTAIKGQMFFNQLVKHSESRINEFTSLLKECIKKPKNLNHAQEKIELLENYCLSIYSKAKDKRKSPKPGSVGYFLSYFWQIQDHESWAIIYTSLIKAFDELGIWEQKPTQKETYTYFYQLNEKIKQVLGDYANKDISNWEAEHAFWNFKGNPRNTKPNEHESKVVEVEEENLLSINASFELEEYLIPKVASLVELGESSKKSFQNKGAHYERLVADIFRYLDFEVEALGQGTGRNPDAILRLRDQNTAFIVDAKAYSNGYSLGVDDRAIKEYINYYCPKLQKEGYKKVGFIVVSNSFKSNFDTFINEITWNTDIKRFILLTSEALLYLLAYKTKDRLELPTIIESLVAFGNPVEAKNIIEEFDDV